MSANVVCARCGNFMCSTCSVSGAEAQCPTCRELNPIGFPYDATADLGTLWSHAFASFQREAVMCIVGGLIFFAFVFGGLIVTNILTSIIDSLLGIHVDPANPLRNLRDSGINFALQQVIGTAVNAVVQGIALVGLYRLLMDVLVGKRADLGRMFSQLHRLPQFVLLQVIMFFFLTVPTWIYFALVGFIGFKLIGGRLDHFRPEMLLSGQVLGLLFGSSILLMVLLVVVLPMTLFAAPELIVGNCDAMEALKRAWQLGSGQRLRMLGYSLLSGVVVSLGVIACCVGLVAAIPMAFLLVLSLFLALRRSSSLPPAVHA